MLSDVLLLLLLLAVALLLVPKGGRFPEDGWEATLPLDNVGSCSSPVATGSGTAPSAAPAPAPAADVIGTEYGGGCLEYCSG